MRDYTTREGKICPLYFGGTLTPDGQDGTPLWFDLASVVHIVIGGATGCGKSTLMHTLIEAIRAGCLLIDPKGGVEFSRWNGKMKKILGGRAYTTPEEIARVIEWADDYMAERFERMARAGARNLEEFRELTGQELDRVAVIIDECADIMTAKNRRHLASIARKGRAGGFHLILATQQPKASAIPSEIRDQCGLRICMRVNAESEARIITGLSGRDAVDIRQLTRAGYYYHVDRVNGLTLPAVVIK